MTNDKERRPGQGDRKPNSDRKPFRKDGAAFEKKPFHKDNASFEKKPFHKEGIAPAGRNFSRDRKPQQARPATVSPARKLALQVLLDVHKNDAYASLSLNSHLAELEYISPEDKRLATALIYGVIENELKLDYALAKFMDRPAGDLYIRDLLRMGAYQILSMDRVPDSAAVNEAVNQAKPVSAGASGMVNGVLRNLVRAKETLEWPSKEEDYEQWLSVMSSTPLWLTQKMVEAYGREEAEAILMYRDEDHSIIVRPNMAKLSDAEFEKLLAGKVWQSKKAIVPHAWAINGASSITLDNDYRSGLFTIQGQSSMLAAEAVQPARGAKILDTCAAPGGKSAYICESMQLTGRVYAWELHENRARLIEGVKRRMGLDNLRVSVRDASVYREDFDSLMDAALLDAPCSGLGVLTQKPDIKHRLHAEDIPAITATQEALLDTVCRYVRPGGTLVYSTCSILPEENALQVKAFLERHPEYELIQLPESIPAAFREQQTDCGLQLLPNRDGVEGFFIARMRRKKA